MRIKTYTLVALLCAILLLGFGSEPSLAAKGKCSGNGALRRRVLSVRQYKPEGGLTRASLII